MRPVPDMANLVCPRRRPASSSLLHRSGQGLRRERLRQVRRRPGQRGRLPARLVALVVSTMIGGSGGTVIAAQEVQHVECRACRACSGRER